ncbi:MarR family transcriptional regulator [Paraburkholderia edwinii]|jgi:DNA-binding MarR family transcriptional regulator|uniref:MarR family transcriptional regulator n=1 Tax=Paraburkholderia edwinii TaxID=2861782 RepID=A0ABX8UX21_9BURK|nr:MarR family transcriptional regulator [Paraburkholderia edwinii]
MKKTSRTKGAGADSQPRSPSKAAADQRAEQRHEQRAEQRAEPAEHRTEHRADRSNAATDASDPSTQRLADYLCFAVYSANLAFGRAYRPILDELGLTYTQYITIIVLWEMGNVTVSALGERLFLESNTLTPILKKLEAMGYLRRQRDPSDERQVLVSLTDAGRDLRENAFGRNLVEATGLNAEEFRKLQKSVTTLRDNLIKHTHNE